MKVHPSSFLTELCKKDGFCLLSTGFEKNKDWLLGHSPVQTLNSIPNEAGEYMGYLAYPNPTLKNTIPESRFYQYKSFQRLSSKIIGENQNSRSFKTLGRLEKSVSKNEYLKKMAQIQKLLSDGEVYQLCYAMRFRKRFTGNSFALFLKLFQAQPSAFSAYLNCGSFQILSLSPERFFKIEKNKIITEPIKGTIAKSTDFLSGKCKVDPNLNILLESEKERAELDMITDLERNDIGRICEYGSLKVTQERAVLEMPHLWHAYSQVEGHLPANSKLSDIMQAMFPGGSITGCPKIRAMEYIEKLENLPRNIFTGSIGYVRQSSTGSMAADFNIAIRTILIHNGFIEFWVGSGVVADSKGEKEYEECMLKAERILSCL